MSLLFPRHEAIQKTFSNPGFNFQSQRSTPYQARPELYPAYSVVDDAKNKAQKLSHEAAKEFESASKLAQDKAGKIELYSGKYYAACTFGGMLACVSSGKHLVGRVGELTCNSKGLDSYGRHPVRSCQDAASSRLEAVQE
jgi:hypothetical protein